MQRHSVTFVQTGPDPLIFGMWRNLDARGKRIVNLGDAQVDGDATNLRQVRRMIANMAGGGGESGILLPIDIGDVSGLGDVLEATEKSANRGVPNGYAPLNADGDVPRENLPTASPNNLGIVQTTENLNSTSSSLALAASAGKALQDNKANKATTLAGYNITDAYTKAQTDAAIAAGGGGGGGGSDLTGTEILERLKPVVGNGSGSGLGADLLDGKTASDFALAADLNAVAKPFVRVLTPYDYGGVGDGVADDTAAVNECFRVAREAMAATYGAGGDYSFQIPFRIDLSGGKWLITGNGINATQMRCWNLEIFGGILVGKCAGVPILDLVNSRGFTLRQVGFQGDKTLMPSCAYQLARDTVGGFCDNCSFYEVSTTGWYSTAAVFVYAHETALHSHCTYFNYNPDAHVAIFQGFDKFPMTSKFTTVMSGGTSFINNKVDICDFRYLPLGDNIRTITGLTMGTNPTVSISAGHTFKAGERVTFAGVGGQDALQRFTCTVASPTATTFVAQGVTTSGSYTGGGAAIRAQTKSSVYLARAQDFNFDSSYIVAYGQPHMTLGFPDNSFRQMHDITLDLLFEGSGQDHNVAVDTGGNTCSIQGFKLKTYNSVARVAVVGITGGLLQALDVELGSYNQLSSANIVEPGANFAGYGCRFVVPLTDDATVSSYAAFTGEVFVMSTGTVTEYGKSGGTDASAKQSFTPSVSCASGAYSSVSASGSYYTQGNLVFISFIVNVNNVGSANGAMLVQLPIPAGSSSTMTGFESGVSGDILSAHIGPNNLGRVSIVKDDNQPPTSTSSGTVVRVGGVYSRV